MTKKHPIKQIMVILLGVIYAIPFYILIVMSFKKNNDFSSKWVLPGYLTFENYIGAWQNANIPRMLVNNVIITIGVIAITVIVGALAAYPLARRKTKINNMIYMIIISLIVLPSISISSNLYKIMIDMHAIDTFWGVILVIATFNLPIVIFLYTGFIVTIPRELEESARIDGCGWLGVFFRIILPLLKTVTVTVVIFVGQAAWNDYGFSLLYLQSPAKQNMTLAIASFFSGYKLNLGWVSAGCIISVIPLAILFFSCQKYFIKGLTDGAIK